MKKLVLALVAMALSASSAVAQSHCRVWPDYNGGCLIAPGPLAGTTLNIYVRNDYNQPIPNAHVQVIFNSLIRICADAVHWATTDANGFCTIQLKGGGCVSAATTGACSVIANGIEIKGYVKVKSPDNAHHTVSNPSGSVNVADLPFFADEFKGTVPAACHDYTNDNLVSVADLPTFGDSFKLGLACPLLE